MKCVLGAILTLIGLFHNVSLQGAETRPIQAVTTVPSSVPVPTRCSVSVC